MRCAQPGARSAVAECPGKRVSVSQRGIDYAGEGHALEDLRDQIRDVEVRAWRFRDRGVRDCKWAQQRDEYREGATERGFHGTSEGEAGAGALSNLGAVSRWRKQFVASGRADDLSQGSASGEDSKT